MTKNMKTRFFYLACAVMVLFGCQSNEPEQKSRQMLSFEVFEQASAAHGLRRVQTDGRTMTTTFSVGDKAGVFAVLNGQVLTNVNNLCLTLNASGVWVPARVVPYTDEYAQAQFYAYFPYADSVHIDPSAADPFAQMQQDYVIPADQSTADKYASADLMTSAACAMNELRAVKLPLAHSMALVSVELPNRSYVFTNADIDPYVIVAPTNILFTLGTNEVKPFLDEATQSYRLIVRPETNEHLAISYDNAGQTHTAEINTLANIWSGEYAHFTIDGGADMQSHTLQVGDFVLSDGGLLSKDAESSEIEAVKANIIGVVCQLKTTDAIQADYPQCKHAIVLSIKEAKAKWSTKGSTSAEENAAGWKTWWIAYGLADLGTTKAEDIDQTALMPTGYEYTKAWLAVPSNLTLGGYIVPVKDGFEAYYTAYAESNATPDVATDWFVPSLREWLTIQESETDIAASLARIDATPFAWAEGATVYYWSSNLRAATSMWTFTGKDSSSSADLFHPDSKDSRIYRLTFAF